MLPLFNINQVEGSVDTDYKRNIIVLTDGQVNNAEVVIELLGEMKVTGVGNTHMVGVGDGISFDMIKLGATIGGGEYLFIMNEHDLEGQIIYLLETITEPSAIEVNLIYNGDIVEKVEPLPPSTLKKGKPIDLFLKFNNPITA
jgi:hypothetical protein